MIEMKDLWKFILALFGFGGVAMLATGAWSVPQSGVYSQLLPAQQWLYAGDTARCIWEIHPNTTKTINSVSYGAPGSWTSCTQNSTDFLLWNCSSVTVAEGNVTCPGIRVVQNEYPGTSETLDTENFTFKTASVKGSRFPGCTAADCTITSGASIPNGTYFMRNLRIDAALTFQGNTTILSTENFTLGSTGSITIVSSTVPYVLNISTLSFLNSGTITGTGSAGADAYNAVSTGCGDCAGGGYDASGCCYIQFGSSAGNPGATIIITTSIFNNTNVIISNGGRGGNGAAGIGNKASCATPASLGGNGGKINISTVTSMFYNTGTITSNGGSGGTGACWSKCYVSTGESKNGGIGGNLSVASLNFTSSNVVHLGGGSGGAGGSGTGCSFSAASDGLGGNGVISVNGNISVTQSMITTTGGNWSVSYCANGTGMNWTRFSPLASISAATCLSKPSMSFTVPNSTSNFTAYKQNISVNVAKGANITLLISFSKNNRSSWEWLSPDIYSLPFNSSNNGTPYLDTHRQGSDYANYAWMRVFAFNNSSNIYSDPAYIQFNLTDMATTLTGTAIPNGSVSTNTIRFTCNYTNATASIEAATPLLSLDGVSYSMTFNNTALTYYWNNNQTLLVGPHYWQCLADKANYKSALSTNTSFNITGFGIFYPTGYTSVKLTCPFPTINGMTPAGQKAGIGIFRIQNYNSTMLHNYSIFLNNTLPSGITLYARCDRFSPQLTGWNALSTDTGYKGLLNVNSTNSSAYCWLRMDCVSATPGTYTPFNYIFTEE